MLRLLLLAALCIALASAHGAADPCPPDVQTCLDAGSNCEDLSAGADFFCAPGSFNTNGFIAGCVCQPLPTIGQACNATCVDAKYEPTCHDDGFCRWVGIFGPGESCVSGDPNYINGGCLSDSVCQSGKCSGAQTLAASGAACTTSADCQHGLACVFTDQGVKQCVRPWSAPAGAACDSSEQCEAGLFCNTDAGTNRCEVLTAIDLVCTGNAFGCPGLTYPEPPLYCECPHNAGSNPANYSNTGAGLCRPSLSWVPNSDARDAWSALAKCLSKNGCARGTAFGPSSCADAHCAPQVAALHLFTGRLGKRTCAELAQLPFVIGGESGGAALAASAVLCALLALGLAL